MIPDLSAAACKGAPTDWFFPTKKASWSKAAALCASCPVLSRCLEAALAEEAQPRVFRDGFRGGMTPDQRARLAKSRSVAQP